MKIHIIIPCKGRETVLNVTSEHILAHFAHAKAFGIELGVHWVTDSEVLGKKLNKAVQDARHTQWDYLMILGSDDLLRPQIWGYIRTAIAEGLSALGFNQAVLYDRLEHRAKLWRYGAMTFGAGRCIRRDIVEECDWIMWDDDKENGVDNNQENILRDNANTYIHIIPTFEPVICDIKDDDNLNSFDSVPGIALPADKIRQKFSDLNSFYAEHTKESN